MTTTRVKICGITQEKDAAAAQALGTDAIGIVFYPPSPRYVEDLALAKDIALAAGPFVNVVGLFVDAEIHHIERVLTVVPLNILQFHGNETEKQCRHFRVPYIKALRMRDDIDLDKTMGTYPGAEGFLLDTYVKGVPGGTGKVFDWHKVPHTARRPIIMAGGLDQANVGEAIKQGKPYAVDVSGGVESEPGIKSEAKMAAFISMAKSQH